MYCKNCGKELEDGAIECRNCGCAVRQEIVLPEKKFGGVKFFMISGCLLMILAGILLSFWYFISLCWAIPMTVAFFGKVKRKERCSNAFKVCTLIFVNLIAGIIMFCDVDI